MSCRFKGTNHLFDWHLYHRKITTSMISQLQRWAASDTFTAFVFAIHCVKCVECRFYPSSGVARQYNPPGADVIWPLNSSMVHCILTCRDSMSQSCANSSTVCGSCNASYIFCCCSSCRTTGDGTPLFSVSNTAVCCPPQFFQRACCFSALFSVYKWEEHAIHHMPHKHPLATGGSNQRSPHITVHIFAAHPSFL